MRPERFIKGERRYQAAIQECEKCHDVCVSTTTRRLEQGSRHAEANPIKALLDCIDFCTTFVGFMLRDSLAHRRVCEICAEVCDACAVSCEGFPDDKVGNECAKEMTALNPAGRWHVPRTMPKRLASSGAATTAPGCRARYHR